MKAQSLYHYVRSLNALICRCPRTPDDGDGSNSFDIDLTRACSALTSLGLAGANGIRAPRLRSEDLRFRNGMRERIDLEEQPEEDDVAGYSCSNATLYVVNHEEAVRQAVGGNTVARK